MASSTRSDRPGRGSGPAGVFELLPGTGLHEDEIELGKVSGVFGVRGQVRLFLHHPSSDYLHKPRKVLFLAPDGSRHRGVLRSRSGAGKRILGIVQGFTDRDHAQAMIDWRVAVRRAHLPQLDDDSFYFWQLVDAEVVVQGAEDVVLGRVLTVHDTEGGEVFELDLGAEETAFLPCVQAFVARVEASEGRVVLTPEASQALALDADQAVDDGAQDG